MLFTWKGGSMCFTMTDNKNEGGKWITELQGWEYVWYMMMRMWIDQWLDLVGYKITLEKMCFKSLSECRSRIYGVNVKGETVLSRLWGQWQRRTHKVWSCQKMSEADERVCIFAKIMTDTWDHLHKESNDTETSPFAGSYMILEVSERNREQVWCDVTYGIKWHAWQQHSAPSGIYQWDSWVPLQTRS